MPPLLLMTENGRLQTLYDRVVGRYDVAVLLYYALGYRYHAYRRHAIKALHLQPGDTAIDLGCGTGVNLAALREAVGAEGRVIGVDLTSGMLAEAQRRVELRGWQNVRLVQSDAAAFAYPARTNGVLATFSISMMPAPECVIARAAEALAPNGRFALADFRAPAWWPDRIRRVAVALARPFGETEEMARRCLWEPMERYLADVRVGHYYFGAAYVASGQATSEDHISRRPVAQPCIQGAAEQSAT
ncbi:MAG: class I SAM-dependent methyltransferase [Rhodothermales bacterium]